ncbi:N-6 DNA methylase [Rhizobium sp. BG6]|uniref:N-6 DNA methylase n=1 Tax=Rhizobium TaxID=379 RepID=UPI0018853B3F|nr:MULTISPECIES: N-6 DNA methylase [Rhizobium]QRM50213.1 N-6 DNA methylase [Rhizobium sp. BG6]
MLDKDTKRRIDTCRDILVGKVPDPKSQVEQITVALIYKFMDDMDLEAEELGGERKFFTQEYERYRWAKLVAPGVSGQEMLNIYSEALTKMVGNDNLPALFRSIFRNAYLPYRDPETLRSFLREIDSFTYDHSERLGDAFEYLLSVLGSQGDAGQFRTPRHIIDFMVEIIDPKKNEVILDPACGTAGFLISAYKHILKANSSYVVNGAGNENAENERTNVAEQGLESPMRFPGDLLSSEDRMRLAGNIKGYDISPDMVRLSLVNLYLHGFADPKVEEYDTLTSEEKWTQTADVIFANPPFMSPKGGIKPHTRFQVQSKRSEVLFVDYIVEHLNPNGRAAIIVPEGIHFVQQSSYEQLRRILIEGNYLIADIALPHGMFKPYASVKTHILVLDRPVAKQATDVLFIEVDNDGFTQTDTRERISGSQLKEASALLSSFRSKHLQGQSNEILSEHPRAYTVEKTKLLSGRYKHILGRWHDLPNRVVHRDGIALKRVGDLCDIKNGLSPNMATPPGEHVLVVPAEFRKTSDHWDYEGSAVCIPLVSSSGHGKADIKRIHFQEGKFALASTMCALFVKDAEEIRPRFLHLYLEAAKENVMVPLMCGATNVTMDSDQLADLLVPVPKPEIQDEIIETHLIRTKATELLAAAADLGNGSQDVGVASLADKIAEDVRKLLQAVERKRDISTVLS